MAISDLPSSQQAAAAFTDVVDRHQNALYTFLHHLVGDAEQAYDLLQDTFYEAWRQTRANAPPFVFDSAEDERRRWLFHVAYRKGLSVLDLSGGDAGAVEAARAHQAECAYCQAEYAAYRQIDAALHQHLSPPAMPRYRTEELVNDALAWPETSEETQPAAAREVVAPLPAPGRERPQRLANRRQVAAGLAALAAVVILALLAFQAYHTGLLGKGAANDVQFSTSTLANISMVSPTEGWAVGSTTSFREAQGNIPGKTETTQVLLWHYLHGRWAAVNLPLVGILSNITMVSATEGWAIGNHELQNTPAGYGGLTKPVIFHYLNGTWSIASA
jgi:DNA-directed RNA polymerase specialized sigma24 family protein